jgi:hypothetical protein
MITEFKTTFRQDFTIADKFGINAIKDTFNRAFKEWKHNVEYITEFTIILNWKLWEHYDKGNLDYAKLYEKLWLKADNWCFENLKGDDLKYFITVRD